MGSPAFPQGDDCEGGKEKGGADSDGGGGAGGRVWRVNDREAYIKDKMEKS